MKTTFVHKEDADRKWYLVDASGKTLGRLASELARVLRGKNKPEFSTFCDVGDFAVVINAGKVVLTGNKLTDKLYHTHSLYPGGVKTKTCKEMLAKDPTFILHHAVKGMLPKNKLGRAQLKKLKLYAEATHPHQAQMPQVLTIEEA